MINDEQFLERIKSFQKHHNLADTTFGVRAVNDGHFIKWLKNGGSPTIRRANKVIAFMQNFPDPA